MTPATHRINRPPILVSLLAGLGLLLFTLPFVGLLVRAPWSDLVNLATSRTVHAALWLSLVTSLCSMLVVWLFGVPLAWVLARVNFPGRRAVRAIATLSMVLPPVVGGVALFAAYGRRGVLGGWLDGWFGIRLPFTTAAVVMAQTFVAMPFFVLTVEGAFRQLDPRREDAARTLGADEWTVFRRVTVPSIRPALIAGSALAWARAVGEFGATITFAGNYPGTTQTMPLATYLALQDNPDQAVLLSLIMVAVSFIVLFALRDRWLQPHILTPHVTREVTGDAMANGVGKST